jgi:hypothetical protein
LIGKRVRLVYTSDVHTQNTPGLLGAVDFIDDMGTIFVRLDNGSGLGPVLSGLGVDWGAISPRTQRTIYMMGKATDLARRRGMP